MTFGENSAFNGRPKDSHYLYVGTRAHQVVTWASKTERGGCAPAPVNRCLRKGWRRGGIRTHGGLSTTPVFESDQTPSPRSPEQLIADILNPQSPSKHRYYPHESTRKPTKRPPTTSTCGRCMVSVYLPQIGR